MVDEIVDGLEIGLPDDGLMLDLLLGAGVVAPGDVAGHDVEEGGRISDIVRTVVDENSSGGVERFAGGLGMVDDVDLDIGGSEFGDGTEELSDFELGNVAGIAVAIDFDFGAKFLRAEELVDAGIKINITKDVGISERSDDIISLGWGELFVAREVEQGVANLRIEVTTNGDTRHKSPENVVDIVDDERGLLTAVTEILGKLVEE